MQSLHCILIRREWRIRWSKKERIISIIVYSLLFHSLYIQNESTDTTLVEKRNFKGNPHCLLQFQNSGNSGACYKNPFREYNLSAFPQDLLDELSTFPFLQQIAILKDPCLQRKYFPQYCNGWSKWVYPFQYCDHYGWFSNSFSYFSFSIRDSVHQLIQGMNGQSVFISIVIVFPQWSKCWRS